MKSKRVNVFGDRVESYQEDELFQMYLDEGKPEEEARILASTLFKELKSLNIKTRNMWRKNITR